MVRGASGGRLCAMQTIRQPGLLNWTCHHGRPADGSRVRAAGGCGAARDMRDRDWGHVPNLRGQCFCVWGHAPADSRTAHRSWGHVTSGSDGRSADWGHVPAGSSAAHHSWGQVTSGSDGRCADWGHAPAGRNNAPADWGHAPGIGGKRPVFTRHATLE